jgi:RHS repeat-associated protein
MLVPNRHGSSTAYRYGFNGKENDNEIEGEGNWEDYGMRNYNPRIGRFFSVDPLTKTFPWYTPYQFAGNMPIAAIDLDGEEPKIVITAEKTGTAKVHVYGQGNVNEIIVRTYMAIVQYTDKNGKITELGKFNITRDGWVDMGTDIKGNTILYNRSSDPINSKKIFLDKNPQLEKYGAGTKAFGLSSIDSPIPDKYNSHYFTNGKLDLNLPLEAKVRNNGIAEGAEIHEGGWFQNVGGSPKLAGMYGCYGIVDPSQVCPSKGEEPIDSNAELIRFEKALQTANDMQMKEHNVPAKTEVEIKKRTYNKIKIVEKK